MIVSGKTYSLSLKKAKDLVSWTKERVGIGENDLEELVWGEKQTSGNCLQQERLAQDWNAWDNRVGGLCPTSSDGVD